MRPLPFALFHLLIFVLALWGLSRMVLYSDPTVPANVGAVLALLFVGAGSVVSLASWALVRRLWREDRYARALRHGAWAGLLVVALPLLRWAGILTPLVVGAVVLILVGLEALLLSQPDAEVNE